MKIKMTNMKIKMTNAKTTFHNNDYDNAQTNSPMFTKDLKQAVAAVINFVQLCCQQAAFIAGQGDIQEKIYTNCARKYVCNTFTQQ